MTDKPIKTAKPAAKTPATPEPTPELPAPALDDQGRPLTVHQRIERARPPGALDALGGPPLSVPTLPGTAGLPQPAALPEIPRTGNRSFDPPAPEVTARRAHIAAIKSSIHHLLTVISETHERVQPHLEALAPYTQEVITKEDFDPADVRTFLHHLRSGVENLKRDEDA